MQAIIDFFATIGEVVSGLINFVIGLIEDIVFMVSILGQFVANIPAYFSWLPTGVVAILITIFSVVVIYKIIGREG